MFRNRWVRRVGAGLLVLFLLIVGGFFALRYNMHRKGMNRLETVTAHLDATDPHWRLNDFDADRGQLPDEQNSALLVPQFKAAMGTRYLDSSRPDKSGLYDNVPPNHFLDDDGVDVLDRVLSDNAAAVAVARSFRDMPHGLRRYKMKPDVFSTLLPELMDTRQIPTALDLHSECLSRLGYHGAALQTIPTMLNASRSIDREPFVISYLVRVACDQIAARRVQRTLALGVPTAKLAEVQAALLQEADSNIYWDALRGERAGIDLLYTNLRNGVLPPEYLVSLLDDFSGRSAKASTEARAKAWAHEPYLANDHATYLDLMTQAIEARRLPEAEQRAALQAIKVPTRKRETALARLIFPNCIKMFDASLRLKANLRCAGVAIAVERFRQFNGRWPESLDEISSDILAAVPLDPIDGNPLRYLRREDGVTIYSLGLDGQDHGGNIPIPPMSQMDPGIDIGVRLYDPQHRGRPPLERSSWLADFEPRDFLDGPPPGFAPPPDSPFIPRAPEPREVDGPDEPQAAPQRPPLNSPRRSKIDE